MPSFCAMVREVVSRKFVTLRTSVVGLRILINFVPLQKRTTAMSTTSFRRHFAEATFLLFLGSLIVLAFPVIAQADNLPDFTGYTRPGYPDGKAKPTSSGQIQFVAD